MEALSNLAGRTLTWKLDLAAGLVPSKAQRHYVLFDGDVPVVTAQTMWQRQAYFDLVMECGEGTFQAHVPFDKPPPRSGVAWKLGEQKSIAGFVETGEIGTFVYGWMDTASGARLNMDLPNVFNLQYVISAPDGRRLFTLVVNGHMVITPDGAADPELPGLVVLALAVGWAQMMELGKHMVGA